MQRQLGDLAGRRGLGDSNARLGEQKISVRSATRSLRRQAVIGEHFHSESRYMRQRHECPERVGVLRRCGAGGELGGVWESGEAIATFRRELGAFHRRPARD